VLFAIFRGLASASGQTSQTGIEGRVTDASSMAIATASVHVEQSDGTMWLLVTDPRGRYRVTDLTPGSYRVRVMSKGFAPFESGVISLIAGRVATLDIRLHIHPRRRAGSWQMTGPGVSSAGMGQEPQTPVLARRPIPL
jgi:hypothetical protein